MNLPQGRALTPHESVDLVTGSGEPRGTLYRRKDGEVYYLGLRADRLAWRERGFRCLGSIAYVRACLDRARLAGVRERSTAWYLLTDAEWQSRVEG